MAEGFVLNISKEMLQRLDAADKKIVQIGESAEKAMKKINEAFGKKLTGVEDFIKQLNDIQQQLSKKDLKVNVDLALKNGALDSLKKQIEALGITIPVGVTATGAGSNAGGSVQNLQSLLDSIVKITTNLESMIKNFPKTTSTSNVSNKGETSIPKTNETLIESVKLWQTLQREVDKYNQELDKVNKEIKRVEEIRKNIASGKGGVYNPKEHQENINRAKDLQDLINKHQAEQKAIIEKNKALSETFNRQKELKNIGTQQQDIELLRLNEDLTKQEQQALELEKQRTKELKEYEKLLIRIAQLKQEQDKVTKIQNTSTDSKVQAQAQQQQQRIQQLLTQANSRRVELENKLGNDVLQAQHKAGAKELEYLRKKEDEKLKEADRAFKELMSKTKRWQQQQDRDQIAFYNTRQGALQYSQNAKTINEKLQAIKYLQNAQKSLDVTTSQGRNKFNELNREIKKTENELRRCGVQMNNFQEKSRHLFDITGQLGRALSLMFSVSQITQYVSKMVNVRKEMELQQRSLQVLLQNKDKANELWNQTLDLAVKSPFRVKELVTYTKQLAAYRIESDKLFETNKMLADVSAGLGVDMQRLILAFGQVKSASFLRGTELRQFTEAGIPMLEELSKYFSEIYGKSVSVAEVFDMISKRMVTFTDVEKVFQRMTGAGGVFFNMQEELSQTTAGIISNLQDSIDLMFNEIGKKNQGLINDVIKAARYLVDNWETVGKVMKGALVTLLLYKTATMDVSKITKGLGANVKAAFSLLKENPLDFVKTFKGNIILTALTAIASILAVIVKRHLEYKSAIKEIVKEYDKLDSTLNNLTIDIYQTEELDEAKQKLLELKNVAKSDFGINVDIQLQNLDSIEQVREEFNKLDQQLKSMNDFIYVIKYQMVEEDTGKEKRDRNKEKRDANLDEDLTNDMARSKGLTKDMEQLDEYSDRLNNTFIKVDGLLGDLLKKQDELNDVQKQFVKAFDKQGDTESDADFFNRRIEGLKLLAKQYEKFYDEVEVNEQSDIAPDIQRMYGAMAKVKDKLGLDINAEEITRLLKDYNQQLNTVNSGIKDVLLSGWGNLNTEIARLEKEMKSKGAQEKEISESIKKLIETYYTSAIKSISTDKEWDDLKEHQAYLVGEQIAKEKGYTVNLVPKIDPSKDIDLKAWQKAYNEEVDEILNTLTSDEDKAIFLPLKIQTDIQGVATTQDKQLATINEAIDIAQKELDRIEKQKTNLDAKLKSGEITKKQYNDLYTANIEKRKKLIEQLTQLRDLLGGDDDKSKGKDTATQRIKDQISLIRQLYEEYQKLTKEMGATTAKGNVHSRFADYAKELGLNIEYIDFTNLQGIYDALEGLETSAKSAGADAMKALTKAMGETSVELELMFYIDERNKFENQIKDMFSDYEISLELDKLNIPKNLASQLFGVDTVDLDDIKTALQNKLNDLDDADISLTQQLQDKNIDDNLKQSLLLQQKGNKQLREQTETNLRKISDMEKKELEERLKTYTKYLLNEQHERVKIRMETLRMLQEVEDTEEYTPAQRQTITDKIKEEERKKLAQQTWKDFEQSPMYMQMFDDVENMGKGALESLITQMGTLKDELQSMGLRASDLKEILGAINKAEEELERRNPFKNFAENAEIAFNRANKIRQLEEQRASQQEDYDIAKSQYDEYQDKLANAQDDLNVATLDIESEEYQNLVDKVEELTEEVNKWKKKVDETTSSLSDINNQINDINDSSNDFYDQLKNIGSITKSVVDGIFQITDAMSWLPEETQLTIDRLQSLSNNVFGIAGGIGSIMSGDIIGGITQIIGSLSGLIATFVEWSSGTKEATIQIERQGRILSNLQNKYDRLNEAIDEAWDTRQIKEYNAELEKNLQQQIIAQKAIIAAQESIKGSDKYGSEQWLELQEAQDELQNLYDMQQELQDNIYEKITGGIIDNTLDAISSWVDAWYDAFKETGDGLKGLEDNFNEMLLNLVKRQAVMKVAGRFIDQWNSVLERYVNNDDNLSLGEITSWANMIEQDLPALSSQLETFFKAFDGILGDTQGNLSGLQRGISSITESQADILASYANSCRFLLASIDTNLSQLASRVMSQTGGGENPMLSELKLQTQILSSIKDMFSSVIKGSHPTYGGSFIKVGI